MSDHSKNCIDLQTVIFIPEGSDIPPRIKLSNCTLPLVRPMPKKFLTGFYGYQAKKDGLMAAFVHGRATKQKPVVINYTVSFDMPLVKIKVSPELLPTTQFVPATNTTRAITDELAGYWKEWLKKLLPAFRASTFTPKDLESFMGKYPDFLPKLMAKPGWDHVQLIAHPARIKFSDQMLTLATLKLGDADITSMGVLLRPDIEVVL